MHYKSCWDYVNINILSIMRYTPYQIIGNIVLTFPVGILLAFVMNYTWKQRIIVSTIFFGHDRSDSIMFNNIIEINRCRF